MTSITADFLAVVNADLPVLDEVWCDFGVAGYAVRSLLRPGAGGNKNKHNDRKRSLHKKAKLNKQLMVVNSAKEYSNQAKALVVNQKLNSENSFEKDPPEKLVEEDNEEEAILSNNPED